LQKLHRLIAINQLSKKNPAWVHDNIFRLFRNEHLWILAYENLKKKKEFFTSGIYINDTTNGMCLRRLKRLKSEVYSESYIFKPVKITQIPRSDNCTRLLSLPTFNDKVVQEVIRLILEAIYEPIFSSLSFGFRGKGAHEALKHVENKFRWVDWVIEGDMEQFYSTIDHHILVKCLSERIKDERFLSLIWKLLGCGIFEYGRQRLSDCSISQGSIVASILSNIYYHKLDEHVNKIISDFSTKCLSKRKTSEQKILEDKTTKIPGQLGKLSKNNLAKTLLIKEIKSIRLERGKILRLLETPIRIEYVRYGDIWMIGISGEKALAEQIKSDIIYFTKKKLKQQVHSIKTKVTNIRKGKAHFLGYAIFRSKEDRFLSYSGPGVRIIRSREPILCMHVPMKKLLKTYIEKGYLLSTREGIRPKSKGSYSSLQDHVIVSHYQSLILGIQNYYSGCTNLRKIQYIQYLLHMSCAMTLGHRHRVSSSMVFHKHGKNLRVKVATTTSTVELKFKTTWLFADRKWQIETPFTDLYIEYANTIAHSTIGLPCLLCDSVKKIEMYRLKHICKEEFQHSEFYEKLALRDSKQLPLCIRCHKRVFMKLHSLSILSADI
jgi:retron-type reverse transcriptase